MKEKSMFKRNKTKFNPSALEFLERHEQMLVDECLTRSQQIGAISKTLAEGWERTIKEEADYILSVTRGREALRKTIIEMRKGEERSVEVKPELRYQISSLFLRECWEYLKSDPRHHERLFLITGTITADGTRVLSRMEQVKYDKQSSAYVSADKIDSHQKMLSLSERHGHLVLAVFHSHISGGMPATAPSSIDQDALKRMSQVGCDCLGGIFSLDGYARFFTTSKNFEIQVYGRGIEKVEENDTYKIFKISEVNDRERKGM